MSGSHSGGQLGLAPDLTQTWLQTGPATQRQIDALRPVGAGLLDMAFSPDGDMIATASDTGVILWQEANQQHIGVPLDAGTGPVDVLAFSPDGALLAAGGEDGGPNRDPAVGSGAH